MGFGEAVRTCLRKYVDFTGRARRSEYWWFVLFSILIGVVAGMVDRILVPGMAARGTGLFGMLASLALLLPSLSVSVRRLHDVDRTGWWVLGFYAALIVLVFVGLGAAFTGHPLAALVAMLGLCGLCVWLIVWFATRGTAGPNRFGPDPLAGDVTPTPSPMPAM